VRIVAPGSPFPTAGFHAGVARLRSWGLEPVWQDDLFARDRFLAGSDERRRGELATAFSDRAARAVFAARGGHGSLRLLGTLDLSGLPSDPKPLIGFSDNTALLAHLWARFGLCGIHGPMIASQQFAEMTDEAEAWYRRLLFSSTPPGEAPGFSALSLRGGIAEGPMVLFNLTILIHFLASGAMPPLQGTILLLEDTGEAAYRIDRMLAVLHDRGVFGAVAGVLFGQFLGLPEEEADAVLKEHAGQISRPTVFRAPVGHGEQNLTLPFGTQARLDADSGRLTILEAAVC
jgi:muramoyltetrapeptide carboxypeptidase